MDVDLVATIARVYPLAAGCDHKKTKPSLELEIEDDDNAHHIIVDRCIVCNLPISSDYATYEQVQEMRQKESHNEN